MAAPSPVATPTSLSPPQGPVSSLAHRNGKAGSGTNSWEKVDSRHSATKPKISLTSSSAKTSQGGVRVKESSGSPLVKSTDDDDVQGASTTMAAAAAPQPVLSPGGRSNGRSIWKDAKKQLVRRL